MTHHKVTDFQELVGAINQALADKTPLNVFSCATKQDFGQVTDIADSLDISGLSGVMDYEPEELIITAHAGTPLADIEKALAEKGQMLAFEAPHISHLYNKPHNGSIGGILATNLSGPRRISAGAARDFLLGFEAVSGRGSAFRSGSKVVKNVTGYDLSKLLCGSFGTLAIMDEITLKVLPAPETSISLLVAAKDLATAGQAARKAFQSPYEPSASAILPRGVGDLSSSFDIAVIRLEGVAVSVNDRAERLQEMLSPYGLIDSLDDAKSKALWASIRDGVPVLSDAGQIWRVSLAPTAGPDLVMQLRDKCDCKAMLDWSGGLVWLHTDNPEAHKMIRQVVADCGGGHATCLRADTGLRSQIAVFEPIPDMLANLNKRIQNAFDPHAILNPGRI